MNHPQADSAELPAPTAMRAGEDPFVRHHAVDQERYQNSGKTDADPGRQPATRVAALGQSAKSVARQCQIGVTDQVAQPQSP